MQRREKRERGKKERRERSLERGREREIGRQGGKWVLGEGPPGIGR